MSFPSDRETPAWPAGSMESSKPANPFGKSFQPIQRDSGLPWVPHNSPLQAWESADGSLIAIANPAALPAEFETSHWAEQFRSDSDLLAIVAAPDHDSRLPMGVFPHKAIWPGGISVLLVAPAAQGPLVFRRKAGEGVGRLRDLDSPLWDWVIRASQLGQTIARIPSSSEIALPLPRLAPPAPPRSKDWLHEHLISFELEAVGATSRDKVAVAALRAGILLWHDFLDESHRSSQSIEGAGPGQLGDYWHAIMHRREPDYSNAKYWFRQIGPHPLFQQLREPADSILKACPDAEASSWRNRMTRGSSWDPFAFVDLCQACAVDEDSPLALAARRIQLVEMSVLLRLSQ